MKKKQTKRKPAAKSQLLPPSVSKSDLSVALDAILNDPPFYWEQIEAIWNWADLRRGGKLQERIEALDRHFVARGKTHKICPIVLLLANGKHK